MAVINAVRGALDMSDLGFDRQGTTSASQTNIRLTFAPDEYTDFGGSYQFAGLGQVTGTVDTITNVEGGKTTFTATDVNADAQRLFALINAGDIDGALAYVLRDDDQITGAGKKDTLFGYGGDDMLSGRGGDDILVGGEGQDQMNGGGGADRFVFKSDEDSGTTADTRDTIFGFSGAELDLIDLKAIDANENTRRNDKFELVDAFSGKAGELVVTQVAAGYLVAGDTDGKDGADFTILVKSDVPLVAADFVL